MTWQLCLPAAGEDLGAVGREADVRDAAALPGQQAEAAAVRLQVQAKRLSERCRIRMVNRFDLKLYSTPIKIVM